MLPVGLQGNNDGEPLRSQDIRKCQKAAEHHREQLVKGEQKGLREKNRKADAQPGSTSSILDHSKSSDGRLRGSCSRNSERSG